MLGKLQHLLLVFNFLTMRAGLIEMFNNLFQTTLLSELHVPQTPFELKGLVYALHMEDKFCLGLLLLLSQHYYHRQSHPYLHGCTICKVNR